MARTFQVTFDAAELARLAEFWADALGYELQPPPEGFDTWETFADDVGIPETDRDNLAAVIDPDGSGPRLLFQKVLEGKTAKNRVHLDIDVGAGIDDRDLRNKAVEIEAARLETLGARRFSEHQGMAGEHWIMMLDPEGNELCLQ